MNKPIVMDAYVFERKQYWISSIADTYPNTIYIYISIILSIHIHTYIYIYIYIPIYIYIYREIYIHICVYIHIYIYIQKRPCVPGRDIDLLDGDALSHSISERDSGPTKDSLSFQSDKGFFIIPLSKYLFTIPKDYGEAERGGKTLISIMIMHVYVCVYIYIYVYMYTHTL